MAGSYRRKLSVNERIFVAGDDFCPGVIANQFIFEGTGQIDTAEFQSASNLAAQANPGSRLVLKGALSSSHWLASGPLPRVREADGSKWDGLSPDGAPFLMDKLDPIHGPTCEIVIVRGHPLPGGSPLRLVFRTHHGVMDGRGTMFWVEEIFRVLNGNPPLGSNSALIDSELAQSIQKQTRRPIKKRFLAPTGQARGFQVGSTWRRIELDGPINKLIGRTALLLAEEAWSYQEGPLLFGIPVDLRRHRPDLKSTANLAYAIYVEINRGTTPEDIALDITRQLEQKYEGMLSPEDEGIRFIPLKILSFNARKLIEHRHKTSNYSISGHISNLGKVNLEDFQGGGFIPQKWFAIPPPGEYTPCFVVLSGYHNQLSLTVTMPNVLASDGRLDSLLNRLIKGLTS